MCQHLVLLPDLVVERLAVIPDRKFVLEQEPRLVGNIQPALRRRADADSERIPLHALRDIDKKLAHPGIVPGQVAGGWIGKEPVQRNAGSAKIDDVAVQDGLVAVK
jgi:hypothetical protein